MFSGTTVSQAIQWQGAGNSCVRRESNLTLGIVSLPRVWSHTGTGFLGRWSMPQASRCSRGIWAMPLITHCNHWSALKTSGRWNRWSLQVPPSWTILFYRASVSGGWETGTHRLMNRKTFLYLCGILDFSIFEADCSQSQLFLQVPNSLLPRPELRSQCFGFLSTPLASLLLVIPALQEERSGKKQKKVNWSVSTKNKQNRMLLHSWLVTRCLFLLPLKNVFTLPFVYLNEVLC